VQADLILVGQRDQELHSPSMLRRRTTAWEDFDFLSHCDFTLVFELGDTSAVSHVLDQLVRFVVGLHLKYDNGSITSVPSPVLDTSFHTKSAISSVRENGFMPITLSHMAKGWETLD
jgi:hypothetical protein